jgi:predicted DNA-binding protein with PD1-like motif
MKFKLASEDDGRTFALILDQGEEAFAAVTAFANEKAIGAASVGLHLHAVLGLRDGSVRGGHLLTGNVRPTLEVTIIETALGLRRRKRADLGIALIET